MMRAFSSRNERKEVRTVPIEDVLATIDNVRRRVAMITYTVDQAAATRDALAVAVDALEQLAVYVAEMKSQPKP